MLDIPGTSRPLQVVADQPLSNNMSAQISSAIPGIIGLLNCEIGEGYIEIDTTDNTLLNQHCENLFYNIQLQVKQKLMVLPDHLTIAIEDTIYSVPMHMMNKTDIKTLPVFQYTLGSDHTFTPKRVSTLANMPNLLNTIKETQTLAVESSAKREKARGFKLQYHDLVHVHHHTHEKEEEETSKSLPIGEHHVK